MQRVTECRKKALWVNDSLKLPHAHQTGSYVDLSTALGLGLTVQGLNDEMRA